MARDLATLVATLCVAVGPSYAAEAQGAGVANNLVTSEHPLPRRPLPGERLVLSTSEGKARLLFRSLEGAPHVPVLPVLADLRGSIRAMPFGSEERCAASPAGADLVVSCAAGSGPAGILIRFEGRLPRDAAVEVALETQGSRGFSAQLLPVGEEAKAVVPVAGAQRLPFPPDFRAEAQLVLVAPQGGGELRITGLQLAPARALQLGDAGAWAWEPDLWRTGGGALIAAAHRRNVSRLYITLPIDSGRVQHEQELARFIRAAASGGIRVEAVEGDPHMVLQAGLTHALARARAIARYQADAPPDARLSGVQYDIEPYVLPEWTNAPAQYQAWGAAVTALSRAVGTPVRLVLPFWIANDAAGEHFLDEVAPAVSGVTAMSYRTDHALVSIFAEPLLHWGSRAGKPIRLALESGPVAAETEEVFAPAQVGRLALVERNGTAIALILSRNASVPGAQMYASQGRVEIRPERISFLGDERRMFEAARDLTPAFSAWRSFDGIDYHGLAWRGR